MPPSLARLIAWLTLCCQPLAFAQDLRGAPAAPRGKTALLIVDAQVGVLASVWEAPRVKANLATLVARARQAGVPVVWVQHADKELEAGSAAWKLAPEFVPTASEPVVHKHFNSSFADTDLQQRLQSLGVSRLVLAGAATNWCIRATAYAAVDRGYDLTLVGDAHSTEPIEQHGSRVIPAESIVTELNTVFSWLSAPNVRTEVTTTAAVRF